MTRFHEIELSQLGTVTGGAAPATADNSVTADNFMPRAKHLQALHNQNDAHPSKQLGAQIYNEFCGSLYSYAKSGAPISGLGSSIARYVVKSEGDAICKQK
jgi:cytochrome c5